VAINGRPVETVDDVHRMVVAWPDRRALDAESSDGLTDKPLELKKRVPISSEYERSPNQLTWSRYQHHWRSGVLDQGWWWYSWWHSSPTSRDSTTADESYHLPVTCACRPSLRRQ
jgi:hypothetical protein